MTDSELREYRHLLRNGNKDEIRRFQDRMRQLHSLPESFSDYMYAMIKRSGRTKAMVAQRSGLSRDYMYKILNTNSGKRTNERDYLIAICMAADMSFMETQHALELYPFPILDDVDDRNAVIIIALLSNMNIEALNEMLENAGHPPLRTSPDMEKSSIGPGRSTLARPEVVSSTHDEELIASVIRRMHMKNEEKIDLWTEPCGCTPIDSAMNAEIKITDDDGVEKYVQLHMSDEVSSLSVSTHSLHEYDPEDDDKCWTEDTCEEVFDTFMAEEELAEIEDEEEAEKYDNYSMMIRMASASKYFSLYLKLDAAIDAHINGTGTEIEIERTKKDLLGTKQTYKVTRDCIIYDGNWANRRTHHEEFADFTDVDLAIEKAESLYNDSAARPENWVQYAVKVWTSDGKLLWENGFSH